jgi:hypothetical protein
MDFSSAIEAVKGNENLADAVGAILAHVDSLKKESIGHRQKASEIEGKHSPLLKILSDNGLDTANDIGEQLAALRKAPATIADDSTKKLSALEKRLADFESANKSLSEKAKRKTIEATFMSTFNENFYNAGATMRDAVANGILGVDEDDKPFVKIGDETFDPATGIIKLREHPEYKDGAKNRQNAGGGSSGASGSEKADSQKEKIDFIKSRRNTY